MCLQLVVLFLATVALSRAGSAYSPYDDVATTLPPPQPFSKLVFIHELGAKEVFDFDKDVKAYVVASKSSEGKQFEEGIHFFISLEYHSSVPMSNATKWGSDQNGHKIPVFASAVRSITVINNNENSLGSIKNPGFIYFVADDSKHVSRVIETTTDPWTIEVEGDNLNYNYVTLLNPSGGIEISNIRNINGLTVLNIQAGGIDEISSATRIYDVNSESSENTTLTILEPIVTIRKLNTVTPSEYSFDVKAVDYKEDSVIKMRPNWTDVLVANSPNFALLNTSNSQRFFISGLEQNTQYDIQVTGDLDESSSLTISYQGYDGSGSESKIGSHNMNYKVNVKGQNVTIDYKRGESDSTKGFLAQIQCYKSARSYLFYGTIVFTILIFL